MKFIPHEYQQYAIDYILETPIAAIFLDMGLGKTVITLSAIFDLVLDSFQVRKVLIVAPLRVARDTWPAEIEKWDHLHGLTYSVAVGTEVERKAALMQKAQIYLINRENVPWLIHDSALPFDYDMVVVDELSSFKSHQAKRFKSCLDPSGISRPWLESAKRGIRPRVVQPYVEPGTLPANQRPALAPGTTRNGCSASHHYQEYNRR